jgi:hypothetical protein
MLTRSDTPAHDSRSAARRGRKFAALAGATGAIAAGTAEAVPYTPTAGVAAAQGIPGFSFVTSADVTLGSLRPPATAGVLQWDVDGVGGDNFFLQNRFLGAPSAIFGPIGYNGSTLLGARGEGLLINNLATGAPVNGAAAWTNDLAIVTSNGVNRGGANFTPNGQFGFRFLSGSDTFYGWGSMVVDLTPAGQGFKITEAYYNTVPGAGINVGAVPVAVPEPSSMALLAVGAAGVTAWRARRKRAE